MESRKKHAILRDAEADEMVAEIDYDFARFDHLPSSVGTVLRTMLSDQWVHDFLAESLAGTVIEIGTGLNTRFERSDNARARWLDLDLPDCITMRRRFPSCSPVTPGSHALTARATERGGPPS
ncbi:class I SAM-dependent methyltransferase [Streptomyces rubiginosohelvolus]|uniref:class I SAM-dependent methyltransferase n=1 Tax=Streptomyces rubiginosohelvolus TaxID=67362 RepID=UPI0035DD5F5B